MRFSLERGLVLRKGQRTFEFVRELPDGEVQLEDMATRRAITFKSHELINKILDEEYCLVVPADVNAMDKRPDLQRCVFNISSLPERHQQLVAYRYDYVKAVQKARTSRGRRKEVERCISATAATLKDAHPPSASSVMGWIRRYETSDGNIASLIDARFFRQKVKQVDPRIEEVIRHELKRSYFTRDRFSLVHANHQMRMRIRQLVRDGKIEADAAKLSYSTVNRRVHDVDVYHRVATREGTARARYVCRTSFEDGHPTYPMERVEIDHTPLNWVAICDRTNLPLGRPILSAGIDGHSGYPLGFYLSFYGPGLTSVLGLVRQAVRPKNALVSGMGLTNEWLSHGVGDEWVIDNGLEFHSFGFKQMAMALGVNLMYCRVRTPWLKPRVERFFGGLDYLTLGRGRVRKTIANARNPDPYKDAAISFSDLVAGLIQFFVDVYPFQINERKLATPYDLFAEGIQKCPPASYSGSLNELRLAAAHSKNLTLGQGGVELLGLPYGSVDFGALIKRHGSRLKVLCKWDPDDMSQLHVQDPQTKAWIVAQCRWKDYAEGLSLNQHRLIRSFSREKLKRDDRIDALLDAKQRLHEHWLDASSRKRPKGAITAARYADFTSANIVGNLPCSDTRTLSDSAQADVAKQTVPNELVIADEFSFGAGEVPDFDAFSLAR